VDARCLLVATRNERLQFPTDKMANQYEVNNKR